VKKTLLVSLLVCSILSACSSSKNIPTIIPSVIPIATLVPTLTSTSVPTTELPPTPTPTLRPTFTPRPTITGTLPTKLPLTPTFTPFPPYHYKQVVFDYYVAGQQAYSDEFFAPESCCTITNIVLYDDGQMIIGDMQKFLLPDEIKGFLSKLDTMGFFSLESNQQADPTDKLYDFGDNYEKIYDGTGSCISVNADESRELCVDDEYRQYLIPEMQSILKYLDDYEPVGMTPYYPDRILVEVQKIDPDSDSAHQERVIPWNKHFPSLEISDPRIHVWDNPRPSMYIDGTMTLKIVLFFRDLYKNVKGEFLFSQNGKLYDVSIREILPHERVINVYQ
jgi:hypothetical protein